MKRRIVQGIHSGSAVGIISRGLGAGLINRKGVFSVEMRSVKHY